MDHDEDHSSTSSTATSEPGNELLQEMMPKLGLEAAEPTGRYKDVARAKHFLSRFQVVYIALLLIVIGSVLLLLPIRFSDVEITETPSRAELEFRLDRLPLFESVTADLDGRPLVVTPLDMGLYHVEAEKNGELTVVARTFTGRETVVTMTVDCVDDTPPFVDHDLLFGGYLYIYLTDGDGENCSGVNWDSVQTTYAATGEPFEQAELDPQFGYVRFPLADESVRVYVEDNNGNPLSLRMDRTQQDG